MDNEVRVSQFRDSQSNFAVVLTDSDKMANTPDGFPIHISSLIGYLNSKAIPNWKNQGFAVFDRRSRRIRQ